MRKNTNPIRLVVLSILATVGMSHAAQAADAPKAAKAGPAPASAPAEPSLEGSIVNVDQIKEKYWARGDESEMGVVQNRAYSKAKRFTLGVIGGAVTGDPFLNVVTLGGSAAYHFSEYLSLSVLGWKHYVSDSSGLQAYKVLSNGDSNVNPQQWYLGTEVNGSVLYGKLSVLGKAIIYYDLHLIGGLGLTQTNNGQYITPHLGIGQRFFLSKRSSLRFDYRMLAYNEEIVERVTANRGASLGYRINYNHAINLSVDFFFEVFK